MNKRILAIVMSLCLLFGVFSVMAVAAVCPTVDSDLPIEHRFCPGTVISEETFKKPAVSGKNIYSEGWEIKAPGKDWGPYDGSALTEAYNGGTIRYYVTNGLGDYDYSNECKIAVRHNPQGKYYGNSMQHWRICADCGGKADVGTHTTMGSDATSKDNVCKVCGMQRNKHFQGIVAFMDWIMGVIQDIITMLG